MDLASYLNISLKPIVESAHQAHFNEESDFKVMQTKSQLERHQQPSVIKEEIEDDDLEETFHNTLRTSKSKPGRNKIINVEATSRHNTAPKYEPTAPKGTAARFSTGTKDMGPAVQPVAPTSVTYTAAPRARRRTPDEA